MLTAQPTPATRGGTLRGPASVVSEDAWGASGCLRAVRPSSVSVNVSCARGPFHSHVNPMTCAQAAPPRRMLRGLRAYKGVDAHIQGFACEQHTAIDTESAKVQTHCLKMTDFRLFSPNGSAVWRAHRLTSRPHHRQSGGIALHEGPTRRRHTPRRLHVVQNPHRRHRGHRRDRRA